MKARTSSSHPLRIEAVTAPTGGQIGMTLFPGRRDSLSVDGPWARDLDEDLRVIEAWHPAIVLTLVENHEFELLGVPDFAQRVAKASFTWHHLPIRDAGVPGADFEKQWNAVGADVRKVLRDGGRVLIHCRAGLGRTGMIAARLLVELGMPSDDAVKAVQTARRHTIETSAQERHVRAQTAVADNAVISINKSTKRSDVAVMPTGLFDRIQGCMLGAAIGDALGAAFEFVSSATIERAIGSPVARDFQLPLANSLLAGHDPGMPTDDTAMTLALATALVTTHPRTVPSFHRRFVELLDRANGAYGKLYWNGGPGGTCNAMLRLAAQGAGPFEHLDPNAGANGAAMRAHPCGFFSSEQFVFELCGMQARLSHPHPGAVAAAQTLALIVHEAVYTGKLRPELPTLITDPTMIAAWKSAHRDLVRGDRLPAHLRDVDLAGWNTVAAAHAIAHMYADDIATGIGIAAASGKDTDTVATMVGAMLGAVHGRSALPPHLVQGLKMRSAIAEIGEKLFVEVIRQADDPAWFNL